MGINPVKLLFRIAIAGGLFLINENNLIAQDSTLTADDSALNAQVATLSDQVSALQKGDSHFLVAGLTTFGFVANRTVTSFAGGRQETKTNSMGDADHYELSPMFLWRHTDKLLVEFEPSFNGYTLGVNWADVSYFAAPGVILRAGYFVLPFGIYNKRLAAGWIDKLASDPQGIDLPGSDFGVEICGGLPLGNMKWSYDLSLTNGLQLLPDGEIQDVGIADNNNNKTITGRLALLPLSNSSLEIGISGLQGNVADAGSGYSHANVSMYALDLDYVKNINPLLINIKGQSNLIRVTPQRYLNPQDSAQTYTFDNTSSSTFLQLSVRPVMSGNAILKNLEFAFRFVNYITPANSLWGQRYTEEDLGLDYWLSWRSVLKFSYELSHSVSTSDLSIGGTGGTTDSANMYLQFSTEF